ncbi:MAG: ATP-binding protein [Candidatus Delongbacteria bacterium]
MDLRTKFEELDCTTISEFVQNAQTEHLQLEFKRVADSEMKKSDDKKNFAKALSGLANSMGGIVIWGIDARKGTDGIDCAGEIIEINDVNLFVSRLNELTGEIVSPLVEGVRHKSIVMHGKSGVAASLIPESNIGPHMAKAGEDRYFKRSGDSFYKMEHFDIADMFGRRQRPDLDISIKPIGKSGMQRIPAADCLISLYNKGRGSAIAPFLKVITPKGVKWSAYGVDGNMNHGIEMLKSHREIPDSRMFGGTSGLVIHPGTSRDVTIIMVPVDTTSDDIDSLVISYEIGAMDMLLKKSEIRLDRQMLADAISRTGV